MICVYNVIIGRGAWGNLAHFFIFQITHGSDEISSQVWYHFKAMVNAEMLIIYTYDLNTHTKKKCMVIYLRGA